MEKQKQAKKKTVAEPRYQISEYKIGNTIYTVELHFNLNSKETLEDIIKRLIKRDIEDLVYQNKMSTQSLPHV